MHRLEATVLFYLPMEKRLIQIIQQDVVPRGDVAGEDVGHFDLLAGARRGRFGGFFGGTIA
jgi:hypothetical protein